VYSAASRVGLDVQAGIGHARRIGQRQVALVGQGLGRGDGNLAFDGAAVVFAGRIAQGLFGGGQVLCHTKYLSKVASRSLPDGKKHFESGLFCFNCIDNKPLAHCGAAGAWAGR
jgi:hypothetical protein